MRTFSCSSTQVTNGAALLPTMLSHVPLVASFSSMPRPHRAHNHHRYHWSRSPCFGVPQILYSEEARGQIGITGNGKKRRRAFWCSRQGRDTVRRTSTVRKLRRAVVPAARWRLGASVAGGATSRSQAQERHVDRGERRRAGRRSTRSR